MKQKLITCILVAGHFALLLLEVDVEVIVREGSVGLGVKDLHRTPAAAFLPRSFLGVLCLGRPASRLRAVFRRLVFLVGSGRVDGGFIWLAGRIGFGTRFGAALGRLCWWHREVV